MGCFDEESTPRHLLYHSGSDNLYEDYNPATVAEALGTGEIDDVTDIAKFEELFKKKVKNGGM